MYVSDERGDGDEGSDAVEDVPGRPQILAQVWQGPKALPVRRIARRLDDRTLTSHHHIFESTQLQYITVS